jgi:hypothetical protein
MRETSDPVWVRVKNASGCRRTWVLVAARVPGTGAHEVIQAHRVYLLELMQQWTRLKEGEAPR